MRKIGLVRRLCLLITLCCIAPGAFAQTTPPKLADLWLVQPKPGHGKEFSAGVRDHMAFRQAQGDPRAWQAYTPLFGERLNQLAVRYCCFAWTDVDAYRQWEAEHPEVQAHFDEHLAPHVESATHLFESMDWANSHWSEANGPWRLFAVTEFQVERQDADDFDEARIKLSQIAIENGWASDDNVWLWASTIGGSPVQSIIVPHRDFAGFEGGGRTFVDFLAEQLGSEADAAELMHEFISATRGSSFQIWEHQPELSMPESE